MYGLVEFRIRVPVEIKQEGALFISSCQLLDVHSQGRTEEEAKNNVVEAIHLFVESCFERGTLDEALKERGFAPSSEEIQIPRNGQIIDISLPFVSH